jgi:hypothetical protein
MSEDEVFPIYDLVECSTGNNNTTKLVTVYVLRVRLSSIASHPYVRDASVLQVWIEDK